MDKLIALSLVVIPFISIQSQDIRELKSALAFGVMLAIGLLSFYKGEIKQFSNKWALILVGFVWLNIMISPSSGVDLFGMQLMQFWSWKPFCYILAYIMGIIAISSQGKEFNTKLVLNTMVWAGTVMAGFTLFQGLGCDQFFRSNGMFHEQWNYSGTLGHPAFVGPFIAMIVPIALYLRKRLMASLMVISVLLIQSQVGIGAMILGLSFYFACKGRKQLMWVIVCLVVISGGTVALKHYQPDYVTSSGRIPAWVQIGKDIKAPLYEGKSEEGRTYGRYPITGRGLGSFYYTYHIIHRNKVYQAHNEYLEWAYNCGIIGLFMLLMAIFYIYKQNFLKNEYRTALLSSFTCAIICAGGIFYWQLGASALFTAIIVGLLHRKVEDVRNIIDNIQ